jgi:replicative DNA helicase
MSPSFPRQRPALQMAESGNFFIDDTPGISFQHIQSEAGALSAKKAG